MQEVVTKVCTKCGVERSLEDFYAEKHSKDGKRSICKFCDAKRKAIWHLNNLEKNHNRNHRWFKNNKEKRNIYEKNKRDNDIQYKLRKNIRGRLKDAVKNNFKSGSAIKELGCSMPELIAKLESMFYPNPITGEVMSWNNYGFYGWHIDHIIPLRSFDLADANQLKKACHYSNLQPLWAEDNYKKEHLEK